LPVVSVNYGLRPTAAAKNFQSPGDGGGVALAFSLFVGVCGERKSGMEIGPMDSYHKMCYPVILGCIIAAKPQEMEARVTPGLFLFFYHKNF
jgi:hypothetical protein